jgi:Ser/Thr protein kinase RdoA (MazF antagonist)
MRSLEMPIEQQIDLATRAARAGLARYDLAAGVGLDVLKHRENTVFAVVGPGGRKLGALRVHVPGYQDLASINSEFLWMRALAAAGVRTPAVIAARDGALVVSAAIPGRASRA